MQRIDAHQHFWNYDPVRDSWITEDMARIRTDFFPGDLAPLLKENHIDGTVAVQADQSEEQNKFLLDLADKNDFIRGVVGWVDLQHPDVEERLDYYRQHSKMKGFRHVLQGEKQRDLMLNDDFRRGIALLHRYGYTYDILIFPDQLKFSSKLVSEFPDQRFVIDHIAKPYIKSGQIDEWKTDIESIAKFTNVYCKISGMVTEADWQSWSADDLRPYMDVVANSFGADRLMFGSDWPVCLVAGEYREVVRIVEDYFASWTAGEQQKVFGENAIRFYNLYK